MFFLNRVWFFLLFLFFCFFAPSDVPVRSGISNNLNSDVRGLDTQMNELDPTSMSLEDVPLSILEASRTKQLTPSSSQPHNADHTQQHSFTIQTSVHTSHEPPPPKLPTGVEGHTLRAEKKNESKDNKVPPLLPPSHSTTSTTAPQEDETGIQEQAAQSHLKRSFRNKTIQNVCTRCGLSMKRWKFCGWTGRAHSPQLTEEQRI